MVNPDFLVMFVDNKDHVSYMYVCQLEPTHWRNLIVYGYGYDTAAAQAEEGITKQNIYIYIYI